MLLLRVLNKYKNTHKHYQNIINKLKKRNKSRHRVMIKSLCNSANIQLRNRSDRIYQFVEDLNISNRQILVNATCDNDIFQHLDETIQAQLAIACILPTASNKHKQKRVKKGVIQTNGIVMNTDEYYQLLDQHEANKGKKGRNISNRNKSNKNRNSNCNLPPEIVMEKSNDAIKNWAWAFVWGHPDVSLMELLDNIAVEKWGNLNPEQEEIIESEYWDIKQMQEIADESHSKSQTKSHSKSHSKSSSNPASDIPIILEIPPLPAASPISAHNALPILVPYNDKDEADEDEHEYVKLHGKTYQLQWDKA